ncbi:MAG: hypothetical protein Q8K66_11050 [Sediminibacterium sp.]|nr:hypothetical protein [Sediminibacterium sp.]MDP3128394.1 hypothetical protein [Sediminibacterium sp.]
MNSNIAYLLFSLLLFSCNTKPTAQQVSIPTDSITKYKNYTFFNQKLLLSSLVKPYEEDGRNTVSQIALTLYNDIKKYTFTTIFQRGLMTITVAEFKEKDTSFTAEQHINEIIKINENMDAFTIHYESIRVIENPSFSGYWTTGKFYVKGEKSSNMYLNVLTDKKIIITTVAVYENVIDLDIVNKIITSIRKK